MEQPEFDHQPTEDEDTEWREAVQANLYDVLCDMGQMVREDYERPQDQVILDVLLRSDNFRIIFDIRMYLAYWDKSADHQLGKHVVEHWDYLDVNPALGEQAILLLAEQNRRNVVRLFIETQIDEWEEKLDEEKRFDELETMRSVIEAQCQSILEGTSIEW